MTRSRINRCIEDAKALAARFSFPLPPFAHWPAERWKSLGHEADEIRACRLGWDVTDFNLGRYDQMGLTLLTLRNGKFNDPAYPKPYCEKLLFCGEGQVTPFHFHWRKTEDIINRGGGVLVIELYNSNAAEEFTDTPVQVACDGIVRRVSPGGAVELRPGQSITLPPRLYHKFYAANGSGQVLAGEVSTLNDDASDNRFHQPLPRFPTIHPDVPPSHLLCHEYPQAPKP
jgi:D-lyxose ketol-isomerase